MTNRTCSVDDCEAPHSAKGYCSKHYYRVWKHGTPDPRPAPSFWDRVEKTPTCWIWTGAKNHQGYGRYRKQPAHRWVLAQTQDIAGLEVDHKCHNPSCVRPDHLQAVSRKANSENLSGAHRDSQTGIRGVTWVPRRGNFKAQVFHEGRTYWGGSFKTAAEAEAAVRALRLRLHTNNLLDRTE